MEKPTPDGYIRLHTKRNVQYSENYLSLHGYIETETVETIRFEDIEHYDHRMDGLKIQYKDRFRVIPWGNITEYEVVYNGPEYCEAVEKWYEEEHKKHLDSELDENCPLCLRSRFETAQIMILPDHHHHEGDQF